MNNKKRRYLKPEKNGKMTTMETLTVLHFTDVVEKSNLFFDTLNELESLKKSFGIKKTTTLLNLNRTI